MLQAEHIEIERTGPGSYRLAWPQAVSEAAVIRASTSPEAITALRARVAVRADGADIDDLPAAARHFFHIEGLSATPLVVCDRHVPLQGARNFRDFGGYTTADGRRVRWGHLYRSGQLYALTAQDQQQVADLGIRLICDFRRDSERDSEPNRLAGTHLPRIENLPIAPGNTASVFVDLDSGTNAADADQVAQYMVSINRDLALLQRDTYRRMFEALLAQPGPLLIHCAVGKDRTGFAAALILAALGVPESTIMSDYLLTARYLPPQPEVERLLKKHALGMEPALLLPLLEAREGYLQAAFAAIREQHVDIDTYLREGLGIDAGVRRELRERLLVA